MKEYKMTMKSYSIDELSKEAKEKAHEEWLEDFDYQLYAYDFVEVLNRFSEIFDINVDDWTVDEYTYSYRFTVLNDTMYEEGMSGNRLVKYLWNNYSEYIEKGKCFFKGMKYRESKLKKVEASRCPLTGTVGDTIILEHIEKCLLYEETYEDYRELIDKCLSTFFMEQRLSFESSMSFENFEEESRANEWEYTENGKMFRLPSDAEIL